MAYVLIFLGVGLAYLDYLGAGNLKAAGSLLKAEFFNYNTPYYKWLGALILVGLLGYVPEMQSVSMALLVLVILAMVLSKSHTQGVGKLAGAL